MIFVDNLGLVSATITVTLKLFQILIKSSLDPNLGANSCKNTKVKHYNCLALHVWGKVILKCNEKLFLIVSAPLFIVYSFFHSSYVITHP